jgi:hypothetical protein
MGKQDIIRMAREASASGDIEELTGDAIERFYDIATAAAVEQERKEFAVHAIDIARKAIEEEREAILDLVHAYAKNNTDLSAAIRARGEMK